MWLQYIFAGLLIAAVVVFAFRKNNSTSSGNILPKRKNNKVKPLVHSETGLTMDDHYRLDKRQKELEINELLDKMNKVGYEKLSETEKTRLKELSDKI